MKYQIYNQDFLDGASHLADNSIDLVVADPPYGLGKDYGNDSDKMSPEEVISWTKKWTSIALQKMKPAGSMYIFCTWRYSPEIFSYLKTKMQMVNEIIWDRSVPSMGGSTRKFSSVHDNIGFFSVSKKGYYFDIDAVRIPYNEETKKARTRSIFVGKKWLEIGYNPKDVWRVSRLHRLHHEREDHPTQKPLEIVERMVLASCPKGGVVLDPFAGSGTTVEACVNNERDCIAFEINSEYCDIIKNRVERRHDLFSTAERASI